MASVITLDHYVLDSLLRDLTGHDKRPSAFLVYVWLAGEQSQQGTPVAISHKALAENTGLSRSAVQSSVAWLLRRKLLTASKANATAVPVYTVQSPWQGRAKAHPDAY